MMNTLIKVMFISSTADKQHPRLGPEEMPCDVIVFFSLQQGSRDRNNLLGPIMSTKTDHGKQRQLDWKRKIQDLEVTIKPKNP
jgi:hypothetical protein